MRSFGLGLPYLTIIPYFIKSERLLLKHFKKLWEYYLCMDEVYKKM